MNGAESLLRTLLANGVDTCFMNPGTSEMQFVAALDRVPGMRAVLCLFEGVCAGAADGYARMTGRPAATLLHLGPGLANGLANFHNARKARSPLVSIVGQHSTQHLRYDAPLSADIEAFARPVSDYVRTVQRVEEIGFETAAVVHAARGQVATLIVPADFSWSETGEPGPVLPPSQAKRPSEERIRMAAELLRSGEPVGLLLGGRTLLPAGFEPAGRIAAATGARVLGHRNGARYACGGGRSSPPRLPYFPEAAEAALAGLRHLILVECRPPVSFFGYPGRRSEMAPADCVTHELACVADDGVEALQMLACELGGEQAAPANVPASKPDFPHDAPLTPDAVGRVLAHLLPENAIVSEETVSSAGAILQHLAAAAAHDLLPVTGGSIGQCLPVAVGAAIACPDRRVIALEGDGSAMYTPQALWTMARERLNITVVILANRRYRILEVEMKRTGAAAIGPRADEMLDLSHPTIQWVSLSEGMGVPAVRVETVDAFAREFRVAIATRGPRLIEVIL